MSNINIRYGIGLGNIIAVILSFMMHHNVWKLIWHGFLGWIYIIYYLIKYGATF